MVDPTEIYDVMWNPRMDTKFDLFNSLSNRDEFLHFCLGGVLVPWQLVWVGKGVHLQAKFHRQNNACQMLQLFYLLFIKYAYTAKNV